VDKPSTTTFKETSFRYLKTKQNINLPKGMEQDKSLKAKNRKGGNPLEKYTYILARKQPP
jgi:hypothetical protein